MKKILQDLTDKFITSYNGLKEKHGVEKLLKITALVVVVSLILNVALGISLCICIGKQSKAASIDLISTEENANLENQEPIKLELNATHTIENYIGIALSSVKTTNKLTGTLDSSYISVNSEAETYIDAVFTLTNLSSSPIESDDCMKAHAVGSNGSKYEATVFCVDNGTSNGLETYGQISPLVPVKFHAAITVPLAEDQYTLTFTIKDSVFTCDYSTNEVVKTVTPISIGDTLEFADYGKLVFNGHKFTDVVKPSKTSGGFYSYYEIDNTNNTYLVLEYDFTNYRANDVKTENILGAKALFMGKYEYNCFVATEDSDKSGLSTFNDIAPLNTVKTYAIIEVPKTISEESFEISVYFNNTEYTYTVK